MEVVREISKVNTDNYDKPRIPVIIVDSGQLEDPEKILKEDKFLSSVAGN